MSKKTFSNPVVNELKGSAWFKRPDDSPSESPLPKALTVAPKATDAASFESPVPVTATVNRTQRSSVQTGQVYDAVNRTQRSNVQQPKKERTKRLAYDLYVSQIAQLRRVRATRELSRNETVSYSQLVREAVDLLFEKEGLK